MLAQRLARPTRSRPSDCLRTAARRPRAAGCNAICDLLHRASMRAAQEPRHQGDLQGEHPGLGAAPAGRAERVCALLERGAPPHAATARARCSPSRDAVIARYAREKDAARPARLRRPDRPHARRCSSDVDAAWVLYKLDLGIDHMLVDEAQDTSPEQWEIVAALRRNSPPAPARADATKRTMFAVGDEKQSIFSFQGAAPRAVRRHDARASSATSRRREARFARRAAARPRSAPAQIVLEAVDAVFAPRGAYRGLIVRCEPSTVHERAARRTRPAASKSGRWNRPTRSDEIDGLGRAVRHAEPRRARRCGSPSASPSACRRMLDSDTRRHGRATC